MSFNCCVFMGRLVRDPEKRSFANGGAVVKFGLAVDAERKKNQATGKWESVPAFVDCEAFNRGETGKTADIIEQHFHKGDPILVRCHVKQENWTAADGQKRSKLVFVVDEFSFCGGKSQGESSHTHSNAWQATPKVQGDVTPSYAPDDATDEPPF